MKTLLLALIATVTLVSTSQASTLTCDNARTGSEYTFQLKQDTDLGVFKMGKTKGRLFPLARPSTLTYRLKADSIVLSHGNKETKIDFTTGEGVALNRVYWNNCTITQE